MIHFIKGLWLRRWFRGCAWTVFTILTLLILARQYEDWSGARRWAAVKEMLAREGESLDIRAIMPDPVPDEQNFFAIAALKDIPLATARTDDKSELALKFKRLTNAWPSNNPGSTASPPSIEPGASLGMPADLKAWADWLRKAGTQPTPPEAGNPAHDVLTALSGNDALVAELAEGLSRPESQWTPAWKTRELPENLASILLPHLDVSRRLARMLCLRSTAAARAGDAETAQQSLLIAARLNQAGTQEPFLISVLVACAQSAGIHGAVWELCDSHAGTAEDFRELQEALSRMDYRAAYLNAGRAELAFGASVLEYLKRIRVPVPDAVAMGNKPQPPAWVRSIFHLVPEGWYDANAATISTLNFEYCVKPLRDGGFPELLSRQEGMQATIDEWHLHPLRHLDAFMAFQMFPAFVNVTSKVIYTQSVENEAIAACALERYRIEHGAYPDTLEAANRPGEKSIPLDVIAGKPMGYRKTPDGRYILWCVAFNGVDHGGRRVLDPKNAQNTKFGDPSYQGDWVWDFPAN
jgi:hypothetical protein